MGFWSCFEDYKPALAMVGVQIVHAGHVLTGKAALTEGLSPMVAVVYRQALATLALAPFAYFTRRRKGLQLVLVMKSFCLLFLAALLGIPLTQYFYFLGLEFGSASLAAAMVNVIPAITFLIAAPLGLEEVSLSSRGIAKIGGTVLCVGGAITIALLKGPKLLGVVLQISSNPPYNLRSVGENWLLGCLFLFLFCCSWSLWLILQVPLTKTVSDPVTLSTWMCFLGLLQSGIITFFIERDSGAWKLDGSLEIIYCIYAGILESAVVTYVQAWCISKRGPVFTATFNPLSTVIAAILGVIILHEDLYAGSLGGAIAVAVGLYIVLWGKAEEVQVKRGQRPPDNDVCETHLEEPLLVDNKRTQRHCEQHPQRLEDPTAR